MTRISFFLHFTAAALVAGGCAIPPTPPQADLQPELSRLERQYATVVDQMASLQKRVDGMERQLQSHDLRLEEFAQQSEQAQKGTAAGQIAKKAPRISPPESPPSLEERSLSATEIYLRAFSNYTSGRYDKAIAGFRDFLERHPDNEYAANAEFWIGECYYSQQKFTEAATHFVGMAEKYPQSARTPQALLNAARAYLELGHNDQGRQIIDFLRQQYPESAAAETQLDF